MSSAKEALAAADLFDVFKSRYGESGEKANIYDAEFRRCVHNAIHNWYMPPRAPELNWQQLHGVYTSIAKSATSGGFQAHMCGTPDCHPMSLSIGEVFADPKYPDQAKLRASGNVWLCARTLRMHVCEPDTTCEYTEHHSNSKTESCAMTMVAKNPRISTAVDGLGRDAARHIDMATFDASVWAAASAHEEPSQASSSSSSSSSSSAKKRSAGNISSADSSSSSKDSRRKRKTTDGNSAAASLTSAASRLALAHDKTYMTKLVAQADPSHEVKDIIGAIFGPTGIAYACAQCLRQSEKHIVDKLREITAYRSVGFSELASLVADASARELVSLLSVSNSLMPSWRVPPEDICYIADCVMRVLILLRQTPVLIDNNTAVGSKGARDREMCVPILCYMRDGCIGRVLRNVETNKLEYTVCTALDEQMYTMSEQDSYTCVARFVFVPAHPGMALALPSVIPPNLAEPMSLYFAKQMRRNRSRELPFLSVLKSPTQDPDLYCLSRYITIRPDLFLRNKVPVEP